MSLRKYAWRVLFVGLIAMATALTLVAQSPTGEIRGTIQDPQGAVVPKATVSITEVATGRTIAKQTNESGLFIASALLPGTYKVTIKATGFTTEERQVVVEAGQNVDASLKLSVGGSESTIEVGAAVAQLQIDTSRSTVDGVITGQQIDQMPLNDRNFLDLAQEEPGVLVRNGSSIDPTKTGAYRAVGLMGRSGTGTRVQIDGIDVTDETVGTTMANISDDAVQEFQLSQSSLDLSTSLTSSGAVSIVTRSGGNAIHGSAFEFYRNQDMGARLAFLPTSQPFNRHITGFRVGGPFKKDKLFWFVNWERTYQNQQGITTSDSNFPNLLGNNCLSGCNAPNSYGVRNIDARLDWNVRSNMRFFYRFGDDWNDSAGGTIPVSPFQNVDWTNDHTLGLDITQGRLSHSIRAGYVKFNNRIITQSFSGFAFPTTSQGIPYFLSVGSYSAGPNSLAPQTTAQDNYDTKYDGSFMRGNHMIRFGGEVNHIILGGFANFAGPLSFSGTFDSGTQTALNNSTNPLDYPLSSFSMGPDQGFFTDQPCDGFKYGCHRNTRIAWYAGDNWKVSNRLTVNYGTRWEYDTGYFNSENFTRPDFLNFYQPGLATKPSMGFNKFGPEAGFAWDPTGGGKTVIRGGAKMAYEMNIYNNLIFDQGNLLPSGIGPDTYSQSNIKNPNGTPVTLAEAGLSLAQMPGSCQSAAAQGQMTAGNYNCLVGTGAVAGGNSIGSVLNVVGALTQTVKNAYNTYAFSPNGTPSFENTQTISNGYLVGGSNFKIPYSLQYNIGVQREIKPGHVLTVDFLMNHGVHMAFLGVDLECRGCASTLNVANATARIASIAGVPAGTQPGTAAWSSAVSAWMAGAGAGKNITSFKLGDDTIYQGLTPSPNAPAGFLQSTGMLNMRVMSDGGFTKYEGLHVSMRGRLSGGDQLGFLGKFLKSSNYIVSYAYGESEATNGAGRPEFLNGALDKFNPTDPTFFGPDSLDFRHMLSGGASITLPFGFRVSPNFLFHTAIPGTLNLPATSASVANGTSGLSGANAAMFTQDFLGEGGTGTTPLAQPIPGTHIGELNRGLNNWTEVNAAISTYNSQVAGTVLPAGQALIKAGLFTQAQLVALKAVATTITPVPVTNPWPYQSYFNMDAAITRPIRLSRLREGLSIEPTLQFFNIFNRNSLVATSTSLAGTFGSLNYNYAGAAAVPVGTPITNSLTQCSTKYSSCQLQENVNRGRQNGTTRLFQIGVRVNF